MGILQLPVDFTFCTGIILAASIHRFFLLRLAFDMFIYHSMYFLILYR